MQTTYGDAFVAEVDPNVSAVPLPPEECTACTESRKRLLRAWIEQESPEGHWGRQTPYRIILGGRDSLGSIGFSQVQNINKYGITHGKTGLQTINLYHPADNIRGFGAWGGEDGGRCLYHAFVSNEYNGTSTEVNYPKLQSTYFTDGAYHVSATDRLGKGLAGFKEGDFCQE